VTQTVEITVEFTFDDDAKPDKRALAEALESMLLLDGLEDLPEDHPSWINIAVSRL